MSLKIPQHLDRNRRIILAVFAVVFSIRIGYIAVRGEVEKEYYLSNNYVIENFESVPCINLSQEFCTDQDRLESIEVYFLNVTENDKGTVTMKILSGSTLIYQTDIKLEGVEEKVWKKIFVNAELKKGSIYQIELTTNEDCLSIPEIPVVYTGFAQEIIASFSDQTIIDGNFAINYGYLRSPDAFDRAVMVSLWILLYAVVYLFVCYFREIQNAIRKQREKIVCQCGITAILCVTEVLAAFAIINCSGIEFQPLTCLIIYALSIISSLNYQEKSEWEEVMLNTAEKKNAMILLYLYAAFALVGQRILIYPLNRQLTAEGLFVYFCAVIWVGPVIKSALFHYQNFVESAFSNNNKEKWKLVVVCILLLIVPAIYNLIGNNPGITNVDTYESLEKYAHELYYMYDWHPFFYSFVLRMIIRLWDSTYAVLIVQYFFWTYVQIELILYLRNKGIKDFVLIVYAFLSGINAANFLHLNTIWKDIPYSYSLLWVFIIITKLVLDSEKYRKKRYIYLELLVALTGLFFFRKNGMVPYIITVSALVVVLRKNIKIIATVLVSITLIGVIKGPVYSHYEVMEPGRRGMYMGLSQDILGAYYGGGEVAVETLQMINIMTKYNNAEYDYNPTWSHQSYEVVVDPLYFLRYYLDTFYKNPVLMTRAIIDREDALWDIFKGENSELRDVNYTGTEDGDRKWNDYYEKRIYRSIYPAMRRATTYSATVQWLNAIEWRGGLFTLIGVSLIVYLLINCRIRRYLLILVPSIGHVMGLLLSTGWSDFRYFWPMNLLNMALIPVAAIILHQYKAEGDIVD